MLLAVDIGNTNIVIGIFSYSKFMHFRLSTNAKTTRDEYCIMLSNLFHIYNIKEKPEDAIISSVVPAVSEKFKSAIKIIFNITPMEVGVGIKTGISIKYDNPKEVGADRIVNAVGAYEEFRDTMIIVDSGTAITFDIISRKGEYLGGAIAPGINISAEALSANAAKLPHVSFTFPKHVIGKTTVESMQSGLMFGCLSMIEGMVRRIKDELGINTKVIATGGDGAMLYKRLEIVDAYRPHLTLFGLKIIYEKNR